MMRPGARSTPHYPPLGPAHAPGASRGILLLILAISLAPRLINLNAPLGGHHVFRQAQTAISVEWAVAEGIRLLDYQTPIYGPPWRWPLEFPTYQVTAAVLAKAGLDVETACRLASLLFFYLSAFLLFQLVQLRGASYPAGLTILLCYLLMPLTVVWSRAAMIDCAAVAFALLYAYAGCRWLDRPEAWWWALASTVSGCLAFLTKVTTMAAWVAFLALLAAWKARRLLRASTEQVRAPTGRSILLLGVGFAQFVIPVAVYLKWMIYSAAVRSQGAATATFSVLKWERWFFDPRQLASADLYLALGRTLWFLVLTAPIAVFAMACVVLMSRRSLRAPFLWWAPPVAALAGTLTHLNMFASHEYYLIGVAPLLAVPMGAAIHEFFCRLRRERPGLGPVLAAVLVSAAAANVGLGPAGRYVVSGFAVAKWNLEHQTAWREAVARHVAPDEFLILAGTETDPRSLYFARRKGLVWRDEMNRQPRVEEMLCSQPFTAIAVKGGNGPDRFPWLFSRFESLVPVEEVGRLQLYAIVVPCHP